jgi:pimeloyl-ACP methyl ester carboxylesterase
VSRATRSYRSNGAATGGVVRYVNSGDARIAYRTLGHGELSVFVLQPFWTAMEDAIADHRSFIGQIARAHRVLVHDRRGTGESERRPGHISLDAMVDDVLAVMTDAGVDKAVLVGMGESAPLAIHVASARSDRVSRLVLIDPALRPLKGPGSAMLLHTLHSRPRAGLRALARTLVDDDLEASELGGQMARAVDGPTAARLYEVFLNADSFSVLDRVTVPVLLAYGVFDRLCSEEEARSLRQALAEARVGLITGPAGSEAALREAWTQIRDFLDEAAAEARANQPARLAPRLVERAGDDEAVPRPARSRTAAPRPVPVDYVPQGAPPRAAQPQMVPPPPGMVPPVVPPAMVPTAVVPNGNARPVVLTWGPPPDIPEEAVKLNRQGIDQLLIGNIEEALALFQKAMDLAPHYEDAAINHRELLTRLVQKRVAEWQAKQAEEMMAEAERRAQRWAERAARKRRGLLGWLLRSAEPS